MIKIRQSTFGPYKLSICLPLVGRTEDELLREAEQLKQKQPDMIEWRVDFFEDIHKIQKVLDLSAQLRETLGDIPLLFTIRSEKEGGEPVPLRDAEKVMLIQKVTMSGTIDIVDFELHHKYQDIAAIEQMAKRKNVKLILSYHNFTETPSIDDLTECFRKAEEFKADIAKVAVMPQTPDDILKLLLTTHEAQGKLDIPVITMAMGKLGVQTRVFGFQYGSILTFAVGNKPSAPGQIPIEDLRHMTQYI